MPIGKNEFFIGLNSHIAPSKTTHDVFLCATLWVSRLFFPGQKIVHLKVCSDLKSGLHNNDRFLSKIITADENILHHYGPDSNQGKAIFNKLKKALCHVIGG